MTEWNLKGKPALVILHMGPRIGTLVRESKEAGALEPGYISRMQALLKAFRERNLPVIYVAMEGSKMPDGSVIAYGDMFKNRKPASTVGETPAMPKVTTELAPQPGEPVLTNWIFGGFTNSGLEQELRSRQVETLILCGFTLQVVVYNTAVQAVDNWYSVIVPQDACIPLPVEQFKVKTTPDMANQVFLEVMFPLMSLVTNTKDVIAHLPQPGNN